MLTVSKAGYTSPQPLLITIYIVDDDQIIIDGLTTQSMSVNQYEQFN
ncbi:hypothetical protein FACS1894166_13130 [Bacilli bacterium]|nr:hypothetical protein FACS1894166_13130 [Bacilli bacterium]